MLEFMEMATWPKVSTTAFLAEGVLAVMPEHEMGTPLSVTKCGLWRLAKDGEQYLGAIWSAVDEHGFIEIAIEPIALYIRG